MDRILPAEGTNTYLVGRGPKRLLIDTGEGRPEWFNLLQDTLSSENATVEKVIITHWHGDHVGGIIDLDGLSSKPTVYKSQIVPNEDMKDIADGQKFEVEGATLRAFHCPGHTEDHMALILEEEDAMFTGDNVLGHGTAVFEDLSKYLSSLEKMRQQIKGRAYPGHGAVVDDCRAKITEYIEHRAMREREVIGVLGQKTAKEGWGVMEIVKIIYKDVPESLHLAASRGVVQILQKLLNENKVFHDEAKDVWVLNKKAVL